MTEREPGEATPLRAFPFVERTGVVVECAERGHVRLRMPLEPNINHVGTMYAGALFTLAEVPGGVISVTTFDPKRFYPIVKGLSIRFTRPARTDVTVDLVLDEDEAERIMAEAGANGKADYELDCELLDADGRVVATSAGQYQIRSHGR